jgi:hypothetical protein
MIMKKYLISIIIAIGFLSCKKEYDSIYEFEDKAGKSYLKLVHTVTNALATPTATAQAGLQVYLNDAKLTGSAITFGGGVFPGLEYALVPASSTTLKAVIPAGTSNSEISVFNGSIALTEKKNYTAFITDTLPATSLFLIEDDLSPIADAGKYFVRFVNVTPKSSAYDLYSTADATTVASNISYKAASSFMQLQVGSGSRTFAVRKPGTTTDIVTVGITPIAGRMYTIFSYGIDGGSGLRAPKVTFFTSRFQTSGY